MQPPSLKNEPNFENGNEELLFDFQSHIKFKIRKNDS